MNFENNMPYATCEQICLAESLVLLLGFAQGYFGQRGGGARLTSRLSFTTAVSFMGNFWPFLKSKNNREADRMMNWVCLCVSCQPPEPGKVNGWINVYSRSYMLGRVLFFACYRNPLADSETKVTIKQSYWSIFHAKSLKTPMPTDLCVPGAWPSSNHK